MIKIKNATRLSLYLDNICELRFKTDFCVAYGGEFSEYMYN